MSGFKDMVARDNFGVCRRCNAPYWRGRQRGWR